MKESLETRIGVFVAFALVVILIILESVGGFAFFKQGYKLHAYFRNVQELKPGAEVRMAGVRVGNVQSIVLTNAEVLVTLNLNKELEKKGQVKTDSKATIKFTGLLGQNFVSIDFGTPAGAPLGDGQTIQTQEQADLSALMNKLDDVATGVQNLTKSFSGESIEKLVGPLTDFVKHNDAALTATIGNLKTVSDRMARGEGTIGKLMTDDALYNTSLNTVSNFQGTAADVRVAVTQARLLLTNANEVVAAVNSGQGTVGKFIKDDKVYREAEGSLTNLHQILFKINHGEGSVGKLVNDESLLKNVKLSLQKLDKATESLEDTGPLSVIGTMVNSLF
ncbi:MAG: Mammalian cell entry related domain protein [Verrucomicrobiales bacterium]|nr:Mammalian cell entry related domain protein [Verrucomicrobiales bacterium]